MNKRFIFEIGLEEIPAAYAYSTMDRLKELLKGKLEENRIGFEDITVLGTPRRLTLIVDGLAAKQDDLEEEVKGPAKKISVDKDGALTKAALGFMRSKGLEEKDIFFKDVSGEEYLFATIKEAGVPTEEILKVVLPETIKGVVFPKAMRWGGKNLKFVRPIRWLVALFGDKVVDVDLEGIVASNVTNGHRFLGEKGVEIKDTEDYFKKLEENFVILDHNERRELIRNQAIKVAEEIGGVVELDDDLLDEVNFLVEYPTAFYGEFDKKYTELPKEAVITPMKQHQRYFPVLKDDKLLPYFIGVRNGNDYKIENVKAGNEKVLEARLADALFFYDEDIKHPLEYYREKLKTVVFQDKLGTVYDKTERLKALAPELLKAAGVDKDDEADCIKRAAELSKADLVTQMVFEFDELQGYMGKEYTKVEGADPRISDAIFEHYLPRFAGDIVPSTIGGSILSIADKLDSICGFFAIGITPTGSQDPYALRRQALGVLNVIKENEIDISLSAAIEKTLDKYDFLEYSREEVVAAVLEFFKERIRNMLRDMGVRYDVIDAVLCSDIDDVYEIFSIAQALNEWVEKGDLTEVLTGFNRVATLAQKADEASSINKELFKEDSERALFEKFVAVKPVFVELLDSGKYIEALDAIADMKSEIDCFFENTMVMADDETIRNNRLALLKDIYETMLMICDLSKIVYK